MGMLDKIFRRKNEGALEQPPYKPMTADEMGLPELETPTVPPSPTDTSADFSEPGLSPLRNYQPRSYSQPQANQNAVSNRDTELILSKLDAIRSVLTNIDIRLANLEKIAGVNEKDQQKGYRW